MSCTLSEFTKKELGFSALTKALMLKDKSWRLSLKDCTRINRDRNLWSWVTSGYGVTLMWRHTRTIWVLMGTCRLLYSLHYSCYHHKVIIMVCFSLLKAESLENGQLVGQQNIQSKLTISISGEWLNNDSNWDASLNCSHFLSHVRGHARTLLHPVTHFSCTSAATHNCLISTSHFPKSFEKHFGMAESRSGGTQPSVVRE